MLSLQLSLGIFIFYYYNIMDNCFKPVLFFIFSILKAKAIFMCIDTNFKGTSWKDHLLSSHTECIITDSERFFETEIWEFKKKLTIFEGFSPFSFLQKHNGNIQTESIYPEEYKIAYIVHTSGSTGAPKVVHVPHSCIIPNINDLR